MSADFLFSFLLFFQVQIESIKESGFYKMLSEKYPEVSQNLTDPKNMDPEVKELADATGFNFEDLSEINVSVEAFDGISKASRDGKSPKLGSDFEFVFSAKVRGEIDAKKMFSFMLDKLEEEKGKADRMKVEKTITKKGNSSSITVPVELLGDDFSDSDVKCSINMDGGYSKIKVGLPGKMELSNASLACLSAMARDRQITFALKVDPSVWERPEFNSQQQNPLFAGLANSVKGIREFGLSVSFSEESLGL